MAMSRVGSCIMAVLITGCAINVRHAPTGPESYLVTADGENHHSHADLTHAAHERAIALCPGGYTIQAHQAGSNSQVQSRRDQDIVTTKESLSQYIICNVEQQGNVVREGPPGEDEYGTSE